MLSLKRFEYTLVRPLSSSGGERYSTLRGLKDECVCNHVSSVITSESILTHILPVVRIVCILQSEASWNTHAIAPPPLRMCTCVSHRMVTGQSNSHDWDKGMSNV